MSDLAGTPGELRFTISITRKATGAVETYDLIGRIDPQPETKPEQDDGSHALDGSA